MNLKPPSSDEQRKLASALRDFSTALAVLEDLTPERVTIGQLLFFTLAAAADMDENPATFVELRDAVGGDWSVSIHTTYKVFLEPSRQFPKGLSWLKREVDVHDQRRKFLRLTPQGKFAIKTLADAAGWSRRA